MALLEWGERFGKHKGLAHIMRRRSERGEPSPLDYRPTLEPALQFAWDAFQACHRERRLDGMAGPLPITEGQVLDWLNLRMIVDVEARIKVRDLVVALDSKWYELRAEERNANTRSVDKRAQS